MSKPNLQPVFIREVVIKAIRTFFDQRQFHEVITPTFNVAIPLEPNIFSFSSTWKPLGEERTFYLSTSPESGLKKMLAQGSGNCYAIGKCFRNMEGAGSRHNPEFLMLEWYREDAVYTDIMADVEELLRFVKLRVAEYIQDDSQLTLLLEETIIDFEKKWPVLSMEQLFSQHAHLDMKSILEDESLQTLMQQRGYHVENATWSQLFDQLFLNEVEPYLPTQPFFLVDFPRRLSPLCKVNAAKPYLAERFEAFINGIEIANGNNENLDVEAIQTSFENEAQARQKQGLATHPYDQSFLTALRLMRERGTSYAGIGMGIDRIAMMMAGVNNLSDVEPFSIQNQLAALTSL
ncbi:MAG TPA: amino acid--tRNA ligase-related protein [Vitreimonas sp.]|nr:amino acid--tRNA ligase-related protein [Vitreimonas sp.]